MTERIHLVMVPQLGVNDDAAVIKHWHAADKSVVKSGDLLCTIETTKAVYEIFAEDHGTLLRLAPLEAEVKVSQAIALIGSDHARLTAFKKTMRGTLSHTRAVGRGGMASEGKATRKAIELAAQLGVRIEDIEAPGIIREKDVRKFADGEPRGAMLDLLTWDKSIVPVVVHGAGPGGVTMCECLDLGEKYRVVCFIDDDMKSVGTLAGRPVFHSSQLEAITTKGIRSFAIAISIGSVRCDKIQKYSRMDLDAINVIHPTAFIAPSVAMGRGNYIKAGATVETGTVVGDGCLIDNGVIIAHDCTLENGCHLAPGVAMGSSIRIGQKTIVGIGASIATKVTIGESCIISVGSSVVRDIPDRSVVEGVPGRIVGTRKVLE